MYSTCIMLIQKFILQTFFLILCASTLSAEKFEIPPAPDTLVGGIKYTNPRSEETLVDIAREFGLGYDQIVKANPQVNRWVPGSDTKLKLPQSYILPDTEKKGLVLNIPELRLYYFPPASGASPATVFTFPVSIGRMDWNTPLGETKVIKKEINPAWRPPQSIREEHAREGEILPDVVPGGTPDNPLGTRAMRLGFPGYLIHGVDERKAFGIGMRVTHGCIRMYPEDVEYLYDMLAVGTPVKILNEPVKIGWKDNVLYLEVHQPLNEGEDEGAPQEPRIDTQDVIKFVSNNTGSGVSFDEDTVRLIAEKGDGIPLAIGRRETVAAIEELQIKQDVRGMHGNMRNVDEPPQSKPSALDEEYNRAVSRYLKPEGSAGEERGIQDPRRRPFAEESQQEQTDIREYLRERY